MNERHDKERFERRAKELFDESVEDLDGHLRSRLNQARHMALAELDEKSAVRWNQWMPAGAVALATVLAVMLWVNQPVEKAEKASPMAALDDLDIMLEDEDLEMLAELDFFLWLEDQPELDFAESNGDVG